PHSYIKSIDKDIHTGLHIYSNEVSPIGPLRKEVITRALSDKEKNLKTYKLSSNASEFWLLLVLGGLKDSSDYSHIEDSIINDKFTTDFDKVFIINFFESKIIELKK
ncbi:MAG: hypothetical protein GY827_06435, partial [Cytophagales bacterium]|nr:hypothetical protein [Cytophagales bacterium]